ncbi:MAG: transcription antitermination factor NusB [Bacteroidota bacterium]|nr:transcription antitermination factor NusB [Bacteroidota bacterium]
MVKPSQTEERSPTRREARVHAMQILYAYELSGEPIEMLVESIAGENAGQAQDHFDLVKRLVYSAINHRNETEEIIRSFVRRWEFDRIARVDGVLLRLGICEFLYFPEIPVKVTIDEYVEIAKQYSTVKSGRFVNGILDAVLHDPNLQSRIRKSGRGLVDT